MLSSRDQADTVRPGETGFLAPFMKMDRRVWFMVIAASVMLFVLSLLLWWEQDIDRFFVAAHNPVRGVEGVLMTAALVSSYGMSSIILLTLAYLVSPSPDGRSREMLSVHLLVIVSFALAGIAGELMKEVFGRVRPSLAWPAEIVSVTPPSTASFPSGHATKSAALALPVLLFAPARAWWQGLLKAAVVLLVVAVCYARIVLGVHYLSDVLAGIGVALVFQPVAGMVAERIFQRDPDEARVRKRLTIWRLVLLALIVYLPSLS